MKLMQSMESIKPMPLLKLLLKPLLMLVFFFGALVVTNVALGVTLQNPVEREKRRLEELFIWKMCEELKLPVEVESSFAQAIRALNQEKSKSLADIEAALIAIEQAKTVADSEKAVKRYEKAIRKFGDVPIREVSRLRRILGAERLSRYLVSKSQMAEKLKAMAQGSTQPRSEARPEARPETHSENHSETH